MPSVDGFSRAPCNLKNASAVRILCSGSLAHAFLLPRSGGLWPRPQKVQWSLSRAVSLEGSPSVATGNARSAAASPNGPFEAALLKLGGPRRLRGGAAAAMSCLLFQVLAARVLQSCGFAVDCSCCLSLQWLQIKQRLWHVVRLVSEGHVRAVTGRSNAYSGA